MIKNNSKRIVITGLMIALGILLPFVTSHGFGVQGTLFLPMHIPVLLCGFFCGAKYGALCGLILPVLNSTLTGMPAIFPMAVLMTGELCAYGFVSGILYKKTGFGKKARHIYPVLIAAMLSGRIVYGVMANILLFFNLSLAKYSIVASVIQGLPGIIIQLVLIPPVVIAVSKNSERPFNAEKDAVKLVKNGEKNCVVVKDGVIVSAESAKGIGHIIKLHESGMLTGVFVADTVVGKAAAMIFTFSGVKKCYGKTMSRAGFEWLESHGVKAEYETLADSIQNRRGDGICPMESTVMNISDEEDALTRLKAKVAELSAMN